VVTLFGCLRWFHRGPHWGGTRNGTVVHWPNGLRARGETRHQFSHVIDVAPTVLEVAGLPEPLSVNGVQQSPMEGTSMRYTFEAPDAPDRHDVQYFEVMGNRGIYWKGWSAITKHRTPWELIGAQPPAFSDDIWELYDGSKDWTQAHNLAAQMPDKLHELQQLFLLEANRYGVFPLDDRAAERFVPEIAGRPTLVQGNSQILFGGMGRLSENSLLNIKNKSFAVTAQVDVPESGAQGVIMCQGGSIAGWSLYAKGGKAKFAYNFLGLAMFYTEADSPIPAGNHQVRMEFAYDGGGLAKGGDVTLFYDGNKVGQGRVEHTVPIVFSADESADVGRDTGTPVTPDYDTHVFNGSIDWVKIDIGSDDHSHYIDPGELMHMVISRQ
jgi:Sulfatase